MSTAARADPDTADHHVARFFALRHSDGEALWISEAETYAVDDFRQRDGVAETDYTAHARAGVAFDGRGADRVAFVLFVGEGEGLLVEFELGRVVLQHVDWAFGV